MNEARLLAIHIASAAAAPMMSLDNVRAVPGLGLEGDRYYDGIGTFSKPNPRGPSREVTLIEIEALEALKRDYAIELKPEHSRRNLLTRGVALNHLVGRDFKIGETTLRGIRLCEPCDHLEKLLQKGVRPGLVHRGGLRAQIVSGGVIRRGDPIEPL